MVRGASHCILTTDDEGPRELAQHGVLLSLADGPNRLLWQEPLSCKILAIPVASDAVTLLKKCTCTPLQSHMAGRVIALMDPYDFSLILTSSFSLAS